MKQLKLLLLLFLASCAKHTSNTEQVLHHDDGLVKPKVAVIKVMDSSNHDLSWDLSNEFTELLLQQLFSHSKFFLTNDFHMIGSNQLKTLELSPYSEDMRWLLEMNSSSEFVLFTEILHHTFHAPKGSSYNPFSHIKTLSISVRVCVLDIRKAHPKPVLQDIITKEYLVPFNFGAYKDDGSSLSVNTFALSPLGIAHKHLLTELAKEIEDYVLIAQSNIYE